MGEDLAGEAGHTMLTQAATILSLAATLALSIVPHVGKTAFVHGTLPPRYHSRVPAGAPLASRLSEQQGGQRGFLCHGGLAQPSLASTDTSNAPDAVVRQRQQPLPGRMLSPSLTCTSW